MKNSEAKETPRRIFDPDVHAWCSSRLQLVDSELGPALPSICWTGVLHPVVKNWVKKQLILDVLDNHPTDEYPEIRLLVEKAKERQAEDVSNGTIPSCQPGDFRSWYLEKGILQFWAYKQWRHRLESLYLANKQLLDLVSCSLLRVSSQQLCFELSQRLKNNEATFSQLSAKFAEGPERKHQGLFEDQPLRAFPKELQSIIRRMKPGEVSKPYRVGERFAILSMEAIIPAQFDDRTQDILIMDELEIWLTAVVHHLKSHLKSNH